MVAARFLAAELSALLLVVSIPGGCATGSADSSATAPDVQVGVGRADPADAGQADGGDLPCDAAGTCAPPCTATPWGTVPDGFAGTAYAAALPNGPCTSETRTCKAGILSGSYASTTCAAGCEKTPWGAVASGFSGTAYQSQVATFGTFCAANTQQRTCTEGELSGTFAYVSCKNYACELSTSTLPHKAAAFSAATAPATFRECQIDGTWGLAQPGDPAALGAPCEWAGSWFPRNTCGFHEGASYKCTATGWVVDTSCPAGP